MLGVKMNYPEFERLVDVVNALRHPETGCPWDLEQTHQSLLRYLMEESYEFMHAVEQKNDTHMNEEIGDVLLQVLLHCRLGQERGAFDLESASKGLADKLVRRHPHVFEASDKKIDSDQVVENWDKIKKAEKPKADSEIPNDVLNFPSLFSSYKIGKKTEKLNFDWDDAGQVLYKVEEEWQELKEQLAPGLTPNSEAIEEELGDFLFTVAQLARHLSKEPEECLRRANVKFLKRFHAMEKLLKADGKNFEEMTQMQLDHYWNQVKQMQKNK